MPRLATGFFLDDAPDVVVVDLRLQDLRGLKLKPPKRLDP
jgi:hypothetical protein